MNNIPNPIIINADIVGDGVVIPAEVMSNDGILSAQAVTDTRPMPHITIGEVETLGNGEPATATMTGDYINPVLNLGLPRGEQGIQGERGPRGPQGERGIPGQDGRDGSDGRDGADGKDGQDGSPGAPGADGFSPVATVSKSGSTTTITITDKDGTTSATVNDGAEGPQGPQGDSYVLTQTDRGDIADIVETDLTPLLESKQDAGNYAASAAGDPTMTALRAAGIMYGECDSTSTSTAFTATIPGVTSYYDGLAIMLKNGVVTSAANFTININGLGAKGSYSNMATGNAGTPTAPTRDTTIFNINYTMLFVYSSTIVDGGAWIGYRGYNSDTNTISYQIRTNSTTLPTVTRTRYYRLLFTSATNDKWVPANTEYDNSATSKKTVNQNPINPFGRIAYLGNSTSYNANANVSASAVWDQYAFTFGYSFNRTGAALTLTTQKPVYVVCAPQTDGSAIMDSTTPIVQALPSTDDGKIYIYLGIAYSATNIELYHTHPVYYYKNGAIRLWTGPV